MGTTNDIKRKQYLSAPSSDTTVKKRKHKHCDTVSQTKKDCTENKSSDSESDCEEDLTIMSDFKDRRTVKARRELNRIHTHISGEPLQLGS